MGSRNRRDSIVATVTCRGCQHNEIEVLVRLDDLKRHCLTYEVLTPSAFVEAVACDLVEFIGVCEACAGKLAHRSDVEGTAALCAKCKNTFFLVLCDFEKREFVSFGGVIDGIDFEDCSEPLSPCCNQCSCIHKAPQMSAS